MAVYRHDRRRRMTLVMLIITSLVLITLDQQGTGALGSIRTAAQDVISPLQDLADSAISPVSDFFDSLGRANEL
jgi:cell shape-determining protein MreC